MLLFAIPLLPFALKIGFYGAPRSPDLSPCEVV